MISEVLVCFVHIAVIVNMASILKHNCLLNNTFVLLFHVSQPLHAYKKVVNCMNYKIKQKQSDFERNAKKILSFEHFSSKIRDIEKKNSSWNF